MAVEDIGFIDCHGGGGLSLFQVEWLKLIIDQLYGYDPYIYLYGFLLEAENAAMNKHVTSCKVINNSNAELS